MGSLYLQKWTTSFPAGEIDPGNVWAACLRGLTADDVKRGLNAMVEKRLEWPPSAIDFLMLCSKNDVPSVGLASQGLISALSEPLSCRSWHNHHPCVYWCYTQIGSFDCNNLKTSELIARVKELWPLAVEAYNRGEIVIPESLRLEKKESAPACREKSMQALSEIKKMLGD